MNRRSKRVLGVTVALITAASLHIAVGHHHWKYHHPHHGKNHPQCENRWHKHGEGNPEKNPTEPQKNQ
jgi:hypothetical protein